MEWSITLFHWFLQPIFKSQNLSCKIRGNHNKVNNGFEYLSYGGHTRNSSGVAYESHGGIWWETILISFWLPSPPLTFVIALYPSKVASSCSSRAPSSSWPSNDELKKETHSEMHPTQQHDTEKSSMHYKISNLIKLSDKLMRVGKLVYD